MNFEELAKHIDLSLLKPNVTKHDIVELIERGKKYPFASVCIPPCHIRHAKILLEGSNITIGTVIGFPHGYQTTPVKLIEVHEAIEAGAGEIDMVMNLSLFKSGERAAVQDEIAAIVSANAGAVVKVIIETCYLTDEEKQKACEMVINAKSHFVKTSTGFGPAGATIADVQLLATAAAGRIKVKASGGIKNLNDTLAMIDAGASRIGTSSGVEIVEEFLEKART